MKLQILIPQYNETDELVSRMLVSIAQQQGVDFSKVEVLIMNDGSDVHPNMDMIVSTPYQCRYIPATHKGLSATRNRLLDMATADYVMFCDADDMFFNVIGLWIIFQSIETGFDVLMSSYIEEIMKDDGRLDYIIHEQEPVRVHGKVYRRQYLLDEGLRFDEALLLHEDSNFNLQAINCSDDIRKVDTPFYLWKWRDGSMCRRKDFEIISYGALLESNDALVDALLDRGLRDKAAYFAVFQIWEAYYVFNTPEWINQKDQGNRNMTEWHFDLYLSKRRDLWDETDEIERYKISKGVQNRAKMEGRFLDTLGIKQWMERRYNR